MRKKDPCCGGQSPTAAEEDNEEVNTMSEIDQVVDVQVEEPKSPAVTQKLEPGNDVSKPRTRRPETQKLEIDPEMIVPAPHLGLTREEMNWAALAHASVLVTLLLGIASGGLAAILGPIIPALIWYTYREKSEYVVEQARQATIFQLAGIVGLLALSLVGAALVAFGWVVSAVLVVLLIGLLLLPLMLIVTLIWAAALVALPIAQVVYGCYAALETYNGRPFRYWQVADLIDRYQAQS
jgi:uncharacterized Tic20 family protein